MSATDEDIALAGEYALGLLDGAEARDFEARLSAEPELREAYRRFAEEFAALSPDPVGPPARVEAKVMAAIFPETPKRSRLWLWLSGGFAALAAVFVLALFAVDPARFGSPTRVADVVGEGVTVAATWTPADGGRLIFERTVGAPPTGRVHELWAIVGDGAPVSLGLLAGEVPAQGERARDVPLAIPEGVDVVLAVSVEPPGGSPTGAPTGEVVGAAPLTPL